MPICALRRLLLLVAALVTAACASTSIRSAWYDQSYHGGAFRKILVVAVHANLATRNSFEDIFVAKLKEAGVDARPGYQALPDGVPVGAPARSVAPCRRSRSTEWRRSRPTCGT